MRFCLLYLDDDFIGSESDEDIGWQDDFVSILGTVHVMLVLGTYPWMIPEFRILRLTFSLNAESGKLWYLFWFGSRLSKDY